jgi:hypothetical protein
MDMIGLLYFTIIAMAVATAVVGGVLWVVVTRMAREEEAAWAVAAAAANGYTVE